MAYWHTSVVGGVVQLGLLHISALLGIVQLGLSPRVDPYQEIMLVTGLCQECQGTQHTWGAPSV